jgi:hypothetical protein
MAEDIDAELAQLRKAYASGALKVRFRDREVTYANAEDLERRIKNLERRKAGKRRAGAYASFSRGDR